MSRARSFSTPMAPCKQRLAPKRHIGPTVSDPTLGTRGIMFNQLSSFARSFALSILLGAVSVPAVAAESQADELAQLKKQLNQSVEMIRALAARVHELETKQGREPAGSATAAAPAPPATGAAPSTAASVKAPPATPARATSRGAVVQKSNQ